MTPPLGGVVVVVVYWLSHAQHFVTPCSVAQQALLSMGFPRQEYWEKKWVAISFSRVSCIGWQVLCHSVTRETLRENRNKKLLSWELFWIVWKTDIENILHTVVTGFNRSEIF